MKALAFFIRTPFFWWFFVCMPIIVAIIMTAGCDADDRVFDCQEYAAKLDADVADLHKTMKTGVVPYRKIDVVESDAWKVRHCIDDLVQSR